MLISLVDFADKASGLQCKLYIHSGKMDILYFCDFMIQLTLKDA